MTIEAVIFDLGGVLVRTEDREPRRHLAESLGMRYQELDQVVFSGESHHRAQLGEIGVNQHWRNVLMELGVPYQDRENFEAQFWGGDRLDVQLVDYIRGLRSTYQTALLSNYWDNLRALITEVWQIEDAFDQIFVSAELGMVKPDREVYRRVLTVLDVRPQRAVFVDDFIENVEGARNAGLHGIHFRSRSQAIQELNAILEAGGGV